MKNNRIIIYLIIFLIIICICLFSKDYDTDSNIKINNDSYVYLENNMSLQTTLIPKHNKIIYLGIRFNAFGNEYLDGNIKLNLIRKKDGKILYDKNINLNKLRYLVNNMYYTFEVDDKLIVKGEEYIINLNVIDINNKLSIYTDYSKENIQVIYGYKKRSIDIFLYIYYYLLIICVIETLRVGDKYE